MAARLRTPPATTPRDLFDLLLAARDPETGAGLRARTIARPGRHADPRGHQTTAVTLFWALTLLAQAPAEQERVAAEAASRSFADRRCGGDAGRSAADARGGRRNAAALSAAPSPWRARRSAPTAPRASTSRAADGPDRALGAAPASPPLARPRCFRSVALPARRAAAGALHLSAVRHRPARLRGRAVRACRGDAGAGRADPRLPRGTDRTTAGAARGRS